jgi:hypothetical protein
LYYGGQINDLKVRTRPEEGSSRDVVLIAKRKIMCVTTAKLSAFANRLVKIQIKFVFTEYRWSP